MLRQAASRRIKETGRTINSQNVVLPTFLTQRYSTEAFEDLIKQGKTGKKYSIPSQRQESVIQRTRQFQEQTTPSSVLSRATEYDEMVEAQSSNWSSNDLAEIAQQSLAREHRGTHQPDRVPGARKKRQSVKDVKHPKPKATNDSSLSALQTLSKLPTPGPMGTHKARRGPKRSASASLFGQEDETEQLNQIDENDTSLLDDDEFWGDVDPDDMRLLRQLTVWRNPVTSEEPGEPALFKTIKTGYDIFAEERTRFELKDTSLTKLHQLDPSSSDYSQYLPETTSGSAGVDASSIAPAQLAKLNLALSHDITLRQRENVVTAIEEFLSRAQPKRTPPSV